MVFQTANAQTLKLKFQLVIKQIGKQTVTISVFWALESLFITKKYFVVKQND